MPFDFDTIPDRSQTNSMKWSLFPKDALPLWVADMDFQSPPAILDALRAALDHGVLGYDVTSRKLQETVAARMQQLYGWKVDPLAVIPTPGIVAGFTAAAWAAATPGQGILIQPPVYPPFLGIAQNVGLHNQYAQLTRREENGEVIYSADMDAFRASFHSGGVQTGAFMFCSPHNPTGQVYTREELLKIGEICLEQGVPILSDEIHSELLLGSARHWPIASLSPELEQKTITLIAPSKTFNVPGLYCGFALVPNPELRKKFKQAVERLVHPVNSLGLLAGEVAYSGVCDDWLAELKIYLEGNRDFVFDYIRTHLPQVPLTKPQATYLAWLDLNRLDLGVHATAHDFLLREAHVALNKGENFGPGGEGFVRLNFGTSRALLTQALERMKTALQGASFLNGTGV